VFCQEVVLGVGIRGATGTAAAPVAGGAAPRHAGLTRLRLLLIGWVVLYHLDLTLAVTTDLAWLRPVLGVGYLGVDGFFLLSGFALWLGYGARPPVGWPAIRRFLLRRMAKIWPLHAVALLLLAVLLGLAVLAGVQIRDPERFGLRDFLLQLFLVNAWETTDRHAWNYPSWALSVEWAGYLAFPLAIQGMLRLSRRAVPLVPALALAGLAALTVWQPWIGLNYTLNLGLLRFALEFALGLALGRLALEGRLPQAWLLAGTAALPLGLLLGQDALTVAGLAALIPAIWQWGEQAAQGRPDPLLRLGEASFGVYLCWVFVDAWLVVVLRRFEFGLEGRLLLMLVGFLASLAAGYLAWRFVEVPAHRWILHRRGGASAPLGLARPAAE
jgi:peptidoglycan/LPS O-acetylase OafA/YrhL